MGKYKQPSTQFYPCCPNEEWKDIEGYENHYQISSCGRVKSIERLNVLNRRIRSRILKQNPTGITKLPVVLLCKNEIYKGVVVSKLVANAFLGKKPGFWVRHKNGCNLNNHVSNLEWSSMSNILIYTVEDKSNTKITSCDVLKIRKLRREGKEGVWLAKMFGVSESVISNIVNKVTWKHVKET
jgi:hypothetical protein